MPMPWNSCFSRGGVASSGTLRACSSPQCGAGASNCKWQSCRAWSSSLKTQASSWPPTLNFGRSIRKSEPKHESARTDYIHNAEVSSSTAQLRSSPRGLSVRLKRIKAKLCIVIFEIHDSWYFDFINMQI